MLPAEPGEEESDKFGRLPDEIAERPRAPFAEKRVGIVSGGQQGDEVARILTERYGPAANPDDMVSLRCDDTQTLVDVARDCDAIVLTINAAGRGLVRLETVPPLNATARFGLVTLDNRAEVPGLQIVRDLVERFMQE